ncbi:hypothetical protein GWO13_08410 [Candidatus Bathyarchaeota archaeon]|nr:hypothetical protein [Candidatus Bathyarchaeota archaeon]
MVEFLKVGDVSVHRGEMKLGFIKGIDVTFTVVGLWNLQHNPWRDPTHRMDRRRVWRRLLHHKPEV